jgi:DNA-binding XRE family transcriptional regulator
MVDETEPGQVRDRDEAARYVRRGRNGTRKRRRWGEASRRAVRRTAGNGGRARRRSLKAIREAQMVTQEELADYCNLSRSTVSALERGRRPQPSTARIIAEILKVGVSEIAWGREE